MGDGWLTYRSGAARLGVSVRTVKRWAAEGMPSAFDDQGRRIIRESVLLQWRRRKLLANPVKQQADLTGWSV